MVVHTWNTLMRACGKLSKLLRCTGLSGKLNLPPNTCMPRREKITIKRKSRRSRQAMERIEFIKEATRLLREVQYLKDKNGVKLELSYKIFKLVKLLNCNNFVLLKLVLLSKFTSKSRFLCYLNLCLQWLTLWPLADVGVEYTSWQRCPVMSSHWLRPGWSLVCPQSQQNSQTG